MLFRSDAALQKGITAGKLHVVLHGKKLKGEYALVKTHGRGENAWLLFKVKDQYVSKEDIMLKDKSVISKKTLAQIKKTTTNYYEAKRLKESSVKSKKETLLHNRSDVKAASAKNTKEKENTIVHDEILSAGKSAEFPSKLSPMLATLVNKPFDKEGWQYEIKWDGYRTVAFCDKNNVELKSRNHKSFNEKFYPVLNAVQQWNINAVVDGEVVVLDKDGKSNFGALQNWRSEADGELYFYVFDLLWMKPPTKS